MLQTLLAILKHCREAKEIHYEDNIIDRLCQGFNEPKKITPMLKEKLNLVNQIRDKLNEQVNELKFVKHAKTRATRKNRPNQIINLSRKLNQVAESESRCFPLEDFERYTTKCIRHICAQILKLNWRHDEYKKTVCNAIDNGGNDIQPIGNEIGGWNKFSIKECPTHWNTSDVKHKWHASTSWISIFHSYFKTQTYNQGNKTTALEIMLDICIEFQIPGYENQGNDWFVSKACTKFIALLKMFGKHLELEPKLELNKCAKLSRYKCPPTLLAVNWEINLIHQENIKTYLDQFKATDSPFQDWRIENPIGPMIWNQIPTFNEHSFTNLFALKIGIQPGSRIANTDEQRIRLINGHNAKAAHDTNLHYCEEQWLEPTCPPPSFGDTSYKFPQWWQNNAKIKCTRCSQTCNFKNINGWFGETCS